MDVDVHEFRLDLQEQHVGRLPAAMQLVFVGGTHRVGDQAVADEAAVDEEELLVGAAAGGLGLTRAARQRQRAEGAVHGPAGLQEIRPQHIGQALVGRTGTPLRHQAAFVPDGKADVGPGQRMSSHGLQRMRELSGVGLEELAPCRGAEKKLAHFHRGPGGARGGLQFTAARVQPEGVGGVGGAAGQAEVGNAGNGGQGFAAEPHGAHTLQFRQITDLAGGVPFQGQGQLLRRDAAAIVLHGDAAHSPGREPDRDLGGAGIQRVVHQFAHHRGGPLHHLARGDLAHQLVGQFQDGASGGGRRS